MESDKLPKGAVVVRGLQEGELAEADRIMRLAFGTFLGLPDPMAFMGDADYVRTRWAADPTVALAAELDGRLVGSNFVTRWGSVGFFGPLTVLPELWNKGVARALLDATMPIFKHWGVAHSGLFTFGHSAKHVALYQSYGFMPRSLTPVMAKAVTAGASSGGGWALLSEHADPEPATVACAGVTDAIYPGFEVGREIRAAQRQKLGDTVLVGDPDGSLSAFAVCHTGRGTEAGSGACFVKVGAVRPGPQAAVDFGRLLDACEAYADRSGAHVVIAGVNTSRRGAYRMLVERGYQADLIGVTMHQPDDDAGYHHAEAWVIDDWR
jgi:GNAT superfamily N-acetyltransferase